VRTALRKRLMDEPRIRASEKYLDQMLLTLARAGFVTLEPTPPPEDEARGAQSAERQDRPPHATPSSSLVSGVSPLVPQPYSPTLAHATPALDKLLLFRSVHPLYAAFLLEHLGLADRDERIQALESVLGVPRPILRYVRVPFADQLPPGPLATTRLDQELIQRGLMAAPLPPAEGEEEDEEEDSWENRPPFLAEKLRLLFDARFPEIEDVSTQAIWCAGELLRFGGNFNLYVKTRDLVKQEGIIFRHLLRLILLCGEFAETCPAVASAEEWRADLRDLSDQLTAACRAVDPTSTDETIQLAHAADVVEGETVAPR
jgi:hypothetical protein